jgi:hypothetical protein
MKISPSSRQMCAHGWTLLGHLALASLVLMAGQTLHAQSYITSPTNTITGTTYFDSDTEVGGNSYVDGSMEVVGDLNADSSINVTGTLYANNLNVTNLYNTYSFDSFGVSGTFELFSSFSSGLSEAWGVGGSWLHSNLDLGDLTYTGSDTPAFNISQLSSGGALYPTIYFTGYDGNTIWVWQENGLAAQAGTGSAGGQMKLDGGGNLTLNNPADGHNLELNPESGSVAVNNPTGALTVSDANADSITINASAETLSFYNGTTHSSESLSPTSVTLTFTSTGAGQAYGPGSTASGNNAFAIGSNDSATGVGSFAIGNNVTAAYASSIVLGQWNANISGASDGNTTWNPTDPLLVIGNGQSSGNRSNALVILKNGDSFLYGDQTINGTATYNGLVNFGGNITLPGNTTVAPQGDILMGQFGD